MGTSLAPDAIFAGDFRIVRTLGQGGMGAVYVAEQLSTGKQRALKTMHPQLVTDAGLRARFAQEARLGARIESEHVVDVVAAGIDGDTGMPWLAMELLKGETVADAVVTERARDPRIAKNILLQLGAALAAAHGAGVVHRDLKPENLFLSTTARPDVPFVLKVLDFGIAKLLSEKATGTTATIGTPLWMAPEQTEVGAAITPATDVWAYGLIAFYVLTGRSYWQLEVGGREVSGAALLRQIVLDVLPGASERAATLGITTSLVAGFDAWFARCVARAASARFGDGREAFVALAQLFEPSSPELSATVPATTLPPSTEPRSSAGATVPLVPTPQPPIARTDGGVANTATRARTVPRSAYISLAVTLAGLVGAGVVVYGMAAKKVAAQADEARGSLESVPRPAPATSGGAASITTLAPRDGALFSSTPVELKWAALADDATHDHDLEIARAEGPPGEAHFPPGMTYVMWPWPGVSASPGAYRWRVRQAKGPWSEWAAFTFYPSVLDRILDRKTIRVGMETTYHEPFVFYDVTKQKVTGFDVDLADAIASDLGVKLERVTHEWKELFTGIETRELDVVISAVSMTKERAAKYGFSDPYLRTGIVVTSRAPGEKVTAPGAGKTVGIQRGTTATKAVHKLFSQATVREYDTLDAAFGALSRAEIDALLADEAIVRSRSELKTGSYRIDGARLSDDSYAVMMPLGDETLRARINAALKAISSSGRLGETRTRYGIR